MPLGAVEKRQVRAGVAVLIVRSGWESFEAVRRCHADTALTSTVVQRLAERARHGLLTERDVSSVGRQLGPRLRRLPAGQMRPAERTASGAGNLALRARPAELACAQAWSARPGPLERPPATAARLNRSWPSSRPTWATSGARRRAATAHTTACAQVEDSPSGLAGTQARFGGRVAGAGGIDPSAGHAASKAVSAPSYGVVVGSNGEAEIERRSKAMVDAQRLVGHWELPSPADGGRAGAPAIGNLDDMATVHDVAALIIAQQHEAGRSIDKLQLQKLLYLVQGAHIAQEGTTAFRAPFRAYANGPVVEQVERTYREFTERTSPIPEALGGDPGRVDIAVADTVRLVLHHFGGWTGPNLERFVKKPMSPWRATRGDLPPGAHSRHEISLREITAWFVTQPLDPNPAKGDRLAGAADASPEGRWFWTGPALDAERQADDDIAEGRVTEYDDINALLSDLG